MAAAPAPPEGDARAVSRPQNGGWGCFLATLKRPVCLHPAGHSAPELSVISTPRFQGNGEAIEVSHRRARDGAGAAGVPAGARHRIPEAKEQVLANLANFAYDPKNYEYLRQLQVLDLFLDMLTEDNETLVEFAIGGLCNLCLDKTNKEYILEANGVEPIINCLSSPNEETVVSAVTTLMFLTTPQSRHQTTALPVVECMLRFSLSANKRLSNLATLFLEDYCSPPQVEEARNLSKHTAVGIPLPKD
ncbi:armadillo repeat-containing protein 7 isoform X1 [Chiroxiphia lanceolata]|uniref:armadillo repeat-containing protein 7 isoform X1 n=1 Tax=Chiroxiphia lanceolata TaxID=296741 RepID=UPI0013CEA130|nr:armadillo repeat-containing protein 7 isoform X1 [Chiroxiphia lanceolata]